MVQFTLKSAQFRREREAAWRELERLVVQAETRGIRTLAAADLQALPTLYRGAVSALSVARAISLDKNLLEYLTNLSCRAYVQVYSGKRRPLAALGDFVTRAFPRAVRGMAACLGAITACLLLGIACGYLLTLADLDRYYEIVPEAIAQGRSPSASAETLREVLYAQGDEKRSRLHLFATFLFTHNAMIGILAFVLGFAAGAPTVLLVFYNGALLGAMGALYSIRGLGAEFWAWVLPHGITELLAVAVCGAAGLALGLAVVFPGETTRRDSLAARGRRVSLAVLGAVAMFFVAALIEGFFRQLVHEPLWRWVLALATLVGWTAYLAFAGRERVPREAARAH